MTSERRGKWHPTAAQVELVLDCVNARLPLEKAAALLNVGPRTISIFARRHGLPFPAPYKPVSSGSGGSRTAETPRPAARRRMFAMS
jgi:hypothetical protein